MSKDLIINLDMYEETEVIEDFLNTMDHALICFSEKAQSEQIPDYDTYVSCLVRIQKALRQNLVRHLQKSPQ